MCNFAADFQLLKKSMRPIPTSVHKRSIFAFAGISMALLLHSCASLLSVANIASCKFRMESMQNTSLAGINIQGRTNFSGLSITDAGRLTNAYLNKNLPLSFILNIEATNPNVREAALHGFDWILNIDDVEMARGRQDQQITIPGDNGKKCCAHEYFGKFV
jgi:hypothetical protein